MKQKVLTAFLLLSIFITGCGRVEDGSIETLETSETVEDSLIPSDELEEEAGNTSVESISSTEPEVETIEYSYEDLYLAVDIPSGWEYEIKTAEDMAMEDGLVTCAIEFWPTEFPDTVFELGYHAQFGLCLTGVTVEDFTLSNGLSGYRYTETMDDILWINIALNNPSNNVSGGAYVISATPKLAVWDTLEPEFEQILDSVWVGARTEE